MNFDPMARGPQEAWSEVILLYSKQRPSEVINALFHHPLLYLFTGDHPHALNA